MIGNFNVNHDSKTASYTLNITVPLIGQFVLTRQHLETCQKYLDGTKQDMTGFETHQLSSLSFKDVPFADFPSLIDKTKTFLADLMELQEMTKSTN